MKPHVKTGAILILGGGLMQIPAIESAREMGLKVFVADGNPEAPGAVLADEFILQDLKDKDGLLSAAETIQRRAGLGGVFTAGTDFSASVAWVAGNLGLAGIPYQTALNATDKVRMRECFRAAGVRSPDFVGLNADDDPLKALGHLQFPLVIKPVDNMGARGIRRIDTKEELIEYFPKALSYARSAKVIIEQYVPGPEFSIDALVQGDTIEICGFADRHIFFPPYFVEMGHTIPTQISAANQESITDMFCRGVKALGINSGAAKGDVKLSPDGPVIGEIAARLSGGYMSGWTFPYSSGIALTKNAISLAMGDPVIDLHPKWAMFSAERAYISIPGKIERITGLNLAEKMPGIKQVLPRVFPGDTVSFPTNNVEKCGNIISQGESRDAAVMTAEAAVRNIFIRLEPANPDTAEFLFGNKYAWVPSAYQLHNGDNRRYLTLLGSVKNQPLLVPQKKPAAEDSGCLLYPELPFPAEEHDSDWHSLFLLDALKFLEDYNIYPAGHSFKGRSINGALFWTVFLRGGIQGAVWLCDTLKVHPDFLSNRCRGE